MSTLEVVNRGIGMGSDVVYRLERCMDDKNVPAGVDCSGITLLQASNRVQE